MLQQLIWQYTEPTKFCLVKDKGSQPALLYRDPKIPSLKAMLQMKGLFSRYLFNVFSCMSNTCILKILVFVKKNKGLRHLTASNVF